jgi:uncharacterized membrane protein YuzA (DUF378 family)
MNKYLELIIKTLIVLGGINYAFMAFDKNLINSIFNDKNKEIIYIIIGICSFIMFIVKVLPDYINLINKL